MKRVLAAVVFFSLAATAWAGNLTVSFLDVGQGDAILVQSPEGKVALVDGGPSNLNLGVDKIDLVIVSHHHADHITGMVAVVEKFKPKVYVDSGSSHTSSTYKRLLSAVSKAGCQFAQPDAGRKIQLGTVTFRLFPQPPEDGNENNNSVGVRLEYGDFSVLLTGDSEKKERAWWRNNADATLYRAVTVLKAAHHGSRNGMNAAWLKATDPKLAVISCGKGNNYGHPHKETLDLLKAQAVPVKRTDVDGTIRIETDGKTWKIKETRLWHRPLALAA
jgi:beta-lactamase superfamily II metal-dependent hydrolase